MRHVARALCVEINVNCHLAAPCAQHGLTLVRTLREVCGWGARLGATPRRLSGGDRPREGEIDKALCCLEKTEEDLSTVLAAVCAMTGRPRTRSLCAPRQTT